MEIDSPTNHTPIPPKKVSWSTDLGVSTLSEELFSHMSEQKIIAEETGELDDFPDYKKPQARIDSSEKLNQRIRFNLIRHKGTVSDIPVSKLFKSFASTLKKADPSLVFHPFQASKQHYSSLVTAKQIFSIDDNKIHQFFKSYHQKQLFSLSGYFHVSSALPPDELFHLPLIDEWLESYRYYIKICPSQAEEMVKIGLLCYGSTFIFRDHLKQAIMTHPLWTPDNPASPPIFDIFTSDLTTPGKKVKMLFVSAEKSRQQEVIRLMKLIYDGTQKSYPNGYMMLFVPIQELTNSTPAFRLKIAFNHEKYIGDEALFSIGGLNDLNTTIHLTNGKQVSIRTLLQSIPASEGMSRPQLFQQVEPNFGVVVTIVTYQADDHDLVIARQSSLEAEIRQVLADGEEDKFFINSSDGIWFGGINKKRGTISIPSTFSKDDADYSLHLQKVMNSPPKKRPITLPKWGGGIPHLAPTPAPIPTMYPTPRVGATDTTTQKISSSIEHRFDVIVAEINHQRECNHRFDNRISSLEVATSNIDQKMDRLLDHFASSVPSSKLQKLSSTPSREASQHPGHPSSLQQNQDHSYHG